MKRTLVKNVKITLISSRNDIYDHLIHLKEMAEFKLLEEDQLSNLNEMNPHTIIVSSTTKNKTPFEYLEMMRESFPDTALFFITDQLIESDVIHAYRLNCDGILLTSQSAEIIQAQIKSALNRITTLMSRKAKQSPEFKLNQDSRILTINGKVYELTPIEFCLLNTLLQKRNKIVKRSELQAALWPGIDEDRSNSVNTHVYNLKNKIPELSEFLKAKKGVGHLLILPDLIQSYDIDSKSRILVIDDDEEIRDILKTILQNDFENIILVEKAEQALELIQNENFDLILLDLYMPGMNGFDFLHKYRVMQLNTPLIICTGYATDENKTKAIRYGAADVIEKPFTNASLLTQVKGKLSAS